MPSSALEINTADRETLESWTRSSTMPAGRVERARIVLAVADGAGTSIRLDQNPRRNPAPHP